MSRFKTICSVILVFSIVMVTLTLGQSLIFRLPDMYLFHFNDSRCVDKLYTSLTSTQMADEIAGFMNSFRPEEFQVHDFTGYDELPIFDSRDSYNMMVMKKMVDVSGIFCIIGLILMVSIYILLVRDEETRLLRKSFLAGAAFSGAAIALQAVILSAAGLRSSYFRLWGVRQAAEYSKLELIMGDDFWAVCTVFLTGISLIILAVLAYVNYRVTRPPRIFY